jgi:hypothetical protein
LYYVLPCASLSYEITSAKALSTLLISALFSYLNAFKDVNQTRYSHKKKKNICEFVICVTKIKVDFEEYIWGQA